MPESITHSDEGGTYVTRAEWLQVRRYHTEHHGKQDSSGSRKWRRERLPTIERAKLCKRLGVEIFDLEEMEHAGMLLSRKRQGRIVYLLADVEKIERQWLWEVFNLF